MPAIRVATQGQTGSRKGSSLTRQRLAPTQRKYASKSQSAWIGMSTGITTRDQEDPNHLCPFEGCDKYKENNIPGWFEHFVKVHGIDVKNGVCFWPGCRNKSERGPSHYQKHLGLRGFCMDCGEDLGDRINDTRTAKNIVHKGHEVVCYWAENPLLDENLCARFRAPPRYATPEEPILTSVSHHQHSQDAFSTSSPTHTGVPEFDSLNFTQDSSVTSAGFEYQPLVDYNSMSNLHFSNIDQLYDGSYGIDPQWLTTNDPPPFPVPVHFNLPYDDRRGSAASYISTPSETSFVHTPDSHASGLFSDLNSTTSLLGDLSNSNGLFNDGPASNFLSFAPSPDYDAFCHSLLNI